MSEKIFNYEEISTNAFLLMVIFVVLFIVVLFIKTIIVRHLKKRKERQENILEETDEIVNEKINHILKIQNNSDDEGFKESLLKEILRNEEDNQVLKSECNKAIKKINKRIRIAEKLDYLRLFFAIVVIGSFCVILSLAPKMSGNVSSLRKMEYENENLKINAYYTVSYSGTDQITLTLYVKNNSDKSLKSASIVQKETGSTAKIINLDPGEEKIVSLNSYKGDKYEFEIQEIVFNE